jgi:hypothetical protein
MNARTSFGRRLRSPNDGQDDRHCIAAGHHNAARLKGFVAADMGIQRITPDELVADVTVTNGRRGIVVTSQ